jgi:signal transduction histidine kinase
MKAHRDRWAFSHKPEGGIDDIHTTPAGPDLMEHPVASGHDPRSVRDLLPMLVRRLPVGVGVVRRDRSLAFANDVFARMLHLPVPSERGDMSMAPLSTDDGHDYEDRFEPVDQALAQGQGTVREPGGIVRPDGTVDRIFITTVPVSGESGGEASVIVYLEGRPEPGETRSLREAFVDTLAHELRTPITAIYGGTQLLRNDELAPDVRATVLTDIADESVHLHLLVEDLIALARIERDVLTVSRDPVLIQRVAEQVAAMATRRWPDRVVAIEAPLDVPATCADDSLVTQILRNLVANAIATSPGGSRIDIRIEATETEVWAHVGDRGPGFPSGLGDDAFHLYQGSPGVASHRPDTGLALFVAGALVRAQGGRIRQQDRQGGGAEVAFSLPTYETVDRS